MLIAGRLVIGINAGLNAGLAPYPPNITLPQGRAGSMSKLIVTISILLTLQQVLGWWTLGTERDGRGSDRPCPPSSSWPLLALCPESPKSPSWTRTTSTGPRKPCSG